MQEKRLHDLSCSPRTENETNGRDSINKKHKIMQLKPYNVTARQPPFCIPFQSKHKVRKEVRKLVSSASRCLCLKLK